MMEEQIQAEINKYTNQIANAMAQCAYRHDGGKIAAAEIFEQMAQISKTDLPVFKVPTAIVTGIVSGLEKILGNRLLRGSPLLDSSETVDRNIAFTLNLIARLRPEYKNYFAAFSPLENHLLAIVERADSRGDEKVRELILECVPKEKEVFEILSEQPKNDSPSFLWGMSREQVEKYNGTSVGDVSLPPPSPSP